MEKKYKTKGFLKIQDTQLLVKKEVQDLLIEKFPELKENLIFYKGQKLSDMPLQDLANLREELKLENFNKGKKERQEQEVMEKWGTLTFICFVTSLIAAYYDMWSLTIAAAIVTWISLSYMTYLTKEK